MENFTNKQEVDDLVIEMKKLKEKYYLEHKTFQVSNTVYGLTMFSDENGNIVQRFNYPLFKLPE